MIEQHRLLAREPVQHGQQRLEDARLLARAHALLAGGARCPGSSVAELGQLLGPEAGEHRVGVARERAQRASRAARRPARPRRAARSRRAARARRRPRRAAASSATSRVLPTPDSPTTKASDGCPAAASASAASSCASSSARPTRRVDVTPVAIQSQAAWPRDGAVLRGLHDPQHLGGAVGHEQALRVLEADVALARHRADHPVHEARTSRPSRRGRSGSAGSCPSGAASRPRTARRACRTRRGRRRRRSRSARTSPCARRSSGSSGRCRRSAFSNCSCGSSMSSPIDGAPASRAPRLRGLHDPGAAARDDREARPRRGPPRSRARSCTSDRRAACGRSRRSRRPCRRARASRTQPAARR